MYWRHHENESNKVTPKGRKWFNFESVSISLRPWFVNSIYQAFIEGSIILQCSRSSIYLKYLPFLGLKRWLRQKITNGIMVAFLMTRNNSNVNILKITWELMVGCDYILVFLVEQEGNYICEMEIRCKFTRIGKS